MCRQQVHHYGQGGIHHLQRHDKALLLCRGSMHALTVCGTMDKAIWCQMTGPFMGLATAMARCCTC